MATFAKMKDGNWGIRGNGAAPAPGAIVNVRKADGSSSTVTVAAVVGKFSDGNWIASIVKSAPSGSARPASSAPRYVKASGKCRQRGCSALAKPGKDGMCNECYFDEYDN
jgi:hypothetical protein